MAIVKAFKALRPLPQHAAEVAALPYDVMSSGEARVMAAGKPWSFLHIDKAEIDLDPSVDPYAPEVYAKARENLDRLEREGIAEQDKLPCLYIYRQVMGGRSQTGLVACVSIDDYLSNVIKKHEHTREDKEADRVRHVDVCDANTGPVFLIHRPNSGVSRAITAWMSSHEPIYDFIAEDGITHTAWAVDDASVIASLESAFAAVPGLYIADGHHRAASAVKVGRRRRREHPDFTGNEEFNFFMAVLFPEDELSIMDYNRVVRDLNGLTPVDFLAAAGENFEISPHTGAQPYRPEARHSFGMYLGGKWYRLKAKADVIDESDPVESLDVSITQKSLLGPILGIGDPRADRRIDFVGGIRGLAELEVRAGSDGVAFSMYPTSLEELFRAADAGEVMPPKSTWFEPKLRSGLFIHKLR